MYLKYYKLSFKPFEISPDPKFLWLGSKQKKILSQIEQGILGNNGLMVLTGDPGTGKTTLVNALANRLGREITFAQIFDPSLEEIDFSKMTAKVLKFEKKINTKDDFFVHLNNYLNQVQNKEKKVVLVIEEAQRINQGLLNQIHLFANLAKPDKSLLTIILVGQNNTNNILKNKEALNKRIDCICKLEPLMDFEIGKYITHRINVAGSSEKIFSTSAINEIYSLSDGIPSIINNTCNLALLNGYKEKKKIITPDIIRKSNPNFQFPIERSEERTRRSPRRIPYWSYAALILLVTLFGFFYFGSHNRAFYMNSKSYYEKLIARFSDSKPEILHSRSNETVFLPVDNPVSKVWPVASNATMSSEILKIKQVNAENKEPSAVFIDSTPARDRTAEPKNGFKAEIDAYEFQIDTLQRQLVAIENEKSLVEASFGQFKVHNNELVNELKTDLQLKDGLIKELHEEQEKLRKKNLEFEAVLETRIQELVDLKAQLSNYKRKEKIQYQSLEKKVETQDNYTIQSDAVETEPEPPNPNDIIDWIIHKNSN